MLISFILMVIILIILCIILNHFLIRYFNRIVLLFILAPGVVIHELSHAVGCLLVGAKIKEIKLFSPKGDSLGYVSHTKAKIPIIGQLVISIAPLVGCSLFLFFIAFITDFPTDYEYTIELTDKDAFIEFFRIIEDGIEFITKSDFTNLKTWVFLYFALSLSANIAPSSKDFKNMLPSIIILGLVLYLIYKIGSGASASNFFSNLFIPLFSFGIFMVVLALIITIPISFVVKILKK